MKVIVEIALYPLTKAYDDPILDFIGRLRAYSELDVKVGETSTVVHGTYDDVFRILNQECKTSLEGPDRALFMIKLVNMER